MSNFTGNSVFVDTSSLESWSTRMSTINKEAMGYLSDFTTLANSLSDSFEGTSAEAFLNSTNEFIKEARTRHAKMQNLDAFLIEVIQTMEKQ